MSATVYVNNISSQTSEKEIREFLSFCGTIQSLSVTPVSDAPDSVKSATVTFEKDAAAKTALLLDNTQLGPSQVSVTAAPSLDEIAAEATSGTVESEKSGQPGAPHEGMPQEDKPRTRILAEYLAHGYVISDKVIERGIALDKQHGISQKFTQTLRDFDTKYHATDKARAVDDKYAISGKAATGFRGMHSYFEKALGTPTGQKLRKFYEDTNKQVVDVHNEARHLANMMQGKTTPPSETFTSTAPPAEPISAPTTEAVAPPPVQGGAM